MHPTTRMLSCCRSNRDPLVPSHAKLPIQYRHPAGVIENQDNEHVHRALLRKPEAKLVTADLYPIQFANQQDTKLRNAALYRGLEGDAAGDFYGLKRSGRLTGFTNAMSNALGDAVVAKAGGK